MSGAAAGTNLTADRFDSPVAFATAFDAFLRSDPRIDEFRNYWHPDIEVSAPHLERLQHLLFEEGWSRLGWSAAFGGLGGDPVFRAAMFETLTNRDIPLPDGFLTLEILAPVLLENAPHLGQRYFAPMLAGSETWSQAFSEPDAGSDLASLRTRMEPDGDGWRITGQKVWSSFAHLSNRSVMLVRSGEAGHRGLTMILLDVDQPGVDVRPIRAEDGRNHFSELFLDGAHLPGDRIIGQLGNGWAVAMSMLQWERGAWGWQQQGRFHRRLDVALRDSVLNRAAPSSLGRAYTALSALRTHTRDTVYRLARGEELGAETSVDKLLLVDAETACYDAARHTLAPLLEVGDDDPSAWWRSEFLYSRAAPIYGGSQEIQRTLVAQRLLGMPRER